MSHRAVVKKNGMSSSFLLCTHVDKNPAFGLGRHEVKSIRGWTVRRIRVELCLKEVYMNTVRLNITLREEVGRILSKVKNKSAYIAEAIKEKKRMDDEERMKRELATAYRAAAEEDYEAYKEWEDTLKDGLES